MSKKHKKEKPLSAERLQDICDYVASYVPLVAEGRQVVVDESAIAPLVSEAAPPVYSIIDRLLGRARESELSPRQAAQLTRKLTADFNAAAVKLRFDVRELEQEAPVTQRDIIMAEPQKISEFYTLKERMNIFREWLSIRHALVDAGAHIETVATDQDAGGQREVYTRDRYIMIGNTAYLPDPAIVSDEYFADAQDYRGEINQIREELEARGVKTVTVPNAWFEGGNVIRHFGSRTIFVGLDGYTYEEDIAALVDAINQTQPEAWSALAVPLTNMPQMYHMDTGMSEELPRGEVMLSRQLTDPDTYDEICRIVGLQNVLEIANDEAANLATNFINVGDTVVLTGICEDIAVILGSRGYKVVMPEDYGQFTFEVGGGGVHCMTNDIRTPPVKRPAGLRF